MDSSKVCAGRKKAVQPGKTGFNRARIGQLVLDAAYIANKKAALQLAIELKLGRVKRRRASV